MRNVDGVQAASELAHDLLHDMGRRWEHVRGVAAKANELGAALADADAEIVEVAAWLHDVGYSRQVVNTGFHPLDGARYLAAAGVDPVVVQLVAHHTGASFEAEERGLGVELSDFPEPPAHLLETLTELTF